MIWVCRAHTEQTDQHKYPIGHCIYTINNYWYCKKVSIITFLKCKYRLNTKEPVLLTTLHREFTHQTHTFLLGTCSSFCLLWVMWFVCTVTGRIGSLLTQWTLKYAFRIYLLTGHLVSKWQKPFTIPNKVNYSNRETLHACHILQTGPQMVRFQVGYFVLKNKNTHTSGSGDDDGQCFLDETGKDCLPDSCFLFLTRLALAGDSSPEKPRSF